MDQNAQTKSWWLTRAEIERTRDKLAKINRRAERRGFAGDLQLRLGESRLGERRDTYGTFGVTETYATLTGSAPHYGEWTFIAAIKLLPGADRPLVYQYEGALLDPAAVRAGVCDHCGTSRRRAHTYLLRDAAGEEKYVGSTCLRDFLGLAIAPALAGPDIDAALLSCPTPREYEPLTLLALAYMADRDPDPRVLLRDQVLSMALDGQSPTEDALAMAGKISAELTAAYADETIGYRANLATALGALTVTRREVGLVASAIAAHARLTPPAAPAAAPITSEWVGEIGDQVTVAATVTTARAIETYYGYSATISRLIVAATDSGDIIRMYTAAKWAREVAAGDAITVTASVKSHDTYRDAKQTVLGRPHLAQAR